MSLLRVSSAITQLASQRSFAVSHIRFSSNDDIMEKRPADKFDKHFIDYLNRPEIDGWEVHKALSELHDFDIIPHPKDVEAALCACRRVNDESELFVPQSKIEYLLEKMMQTQQKSDEKRRLSYYNMVYGTIFITISNLLLFIRYLSPARK